jgi:hypothetical protein
MSGRAALSPLLLNIAEFQPGENWVEGASERLNGFGSFQLFDKLIGRKRSVGDDVLAGATRVALKETTAYYVYKSHRGFSAVKRYD